MSDDEHDVSEAFSALGDETRVAILRALVERRREDARDSSLTFSELRERVGVRDSGRFNYHLQKLLGSFVEEDDGEYGLTYAGGEVAGAILAGTYEDVHLAPTPVEGGCSLCGSDLTATYDDGMLDVTCDDDHTVFRNGVPPAAAADRSMDDLVAFATRLTYADFELVTAGICPECYGHTEPEVTRMELGDEDDPEWGYRTTCDRCGVVTTSIAGVALLHHPEFVAFCADHGVDLHDRLPWALPFDGSVKRTSEDPPRYRVPVDLDDERFVATLDGTGSVVDTAREPLE